MKTCSIAYVLLVTAAIPTLFTLSDSILSDSWVLGDTMGLVGMLTHGISIILFFHLITKCVGLSIRWRIAISPIFPILIYTTYYATIYNELRGPVGFSIQFMALLNSIKFVASSLIVEFAMSKLERRVAWLGCP